MPLILEVSAGGSGWKRAAVLNPGDREGSVSDCRDGHRDVILFRCDGDRSIIRASATGMDFEAGDERTVVTLGTAELAALTAGESFARYVTTDRGMSCQIRWRHEA